ncbi:MAG: OmpA family protein [Bacteroidales bacterium]|nr:OmpA family protein [Bacteroidales bacterium]
MKKSGTLILNKTFIIRVVLVLTILIFWLKPVNAQDSTDECNHVRSKKTDKLYDKAIRSYRSNDFSEGIRLLNEITETEPEYIDAWYVLGLIYIDENRMNLDVARQCFENVVRICPQYDPYTYYHLARIHYTQENYKQAAENINIFLADVDQIRSDEDYNEAIAILDYSLFYDDLLAHPVPFNPKPVSGISTELDEYLPIISPDNEMALFTRRIKIPPRRDDITPQVRYKEKFMFSLRENGNFGEGEPMPHPFNLNDNEGGATLSIDNKTLFYTLCKYGNNSRYYNCDICYSEKVNGNWTPIQSIGDQVNLPDKWESQPTVTSDGSILYFVSDRNGGFGGYDLYKTRKEADGSWSSPVNLGSEINTPGNEKSPFIHTDSQTLYFSSDGHMGLGGYDIFYTRLDSVNEWSKPENIGFPINSKDDDVGFFVSTDGHYGYFASNKFDGLGGWDLYSFELYEEARPEKVLFIRGKLIDIPENELSSTRIELKNVETRKVTSVPVDTATGEYVAAVLFRNDYLMTVKKKGYVQEAKYISRIDPRYTSPFKVMVNMRPIEVGMSYRLNDIYFESNSYELPAESKVVIEEFYEFLLENEDLKISIEGHTDNIGNDQDNLILSQKRAESVYRELIAKGIPSTRLQFKGFGESKPVAQNNTEAGRSRNRRTEFVVIEK